MAPVSAPSSRAETKRRTREALVAATRRLVSAQGFRDTTIEQIAAEAGVSPRTFFRHFPTKEAVLFSRVDDMVMSLDTELAQADASAPVMSALRTALVAAADRVQDDGRWMIQVARLADEHPEIKERLEFHVGYRLRTIIVAWAERHLGVPAVADPRPGMLAGIAAACVETASARWVAYGARPDLPALVDEAFDALTTLLQDGSAT